MQKQKQNFLISKNKLQKVKDKMTENNMIEEDNSHNSEIKNVLIKPQKNNSKENNSVQESQRKLMGSYLQCNVRRVHENVNETHDQNKSRSISQLNKNMKKKENLQKKYTNEEDIQEIDPDNYKIVQFVPKGNIDHTHNNQGSRSTSKTKYQEVRIILCRCFLE